MVALSGVAAGLALGLLFRGRLANLRYLHLQHTWAVLVGVGLQMALLLPFWPESRGLMIGIPVVGSYVLLLVFLASNLRVPGLGLVGVGLAMNLLVIVANGGQMPIAPETLIAAGRQEAAIGSRTPSGKGIVLSPDSTRLGILSDTLVLPLPGRPKIVSIGDVLVFVGLALAVQAALRRGSPAKPPLQQATTQSSIPA
jgi:hypothetical protein